MARVSTSTTCAAYTDFKITADFDVWESGTSVDGNYSTVSWHLVVARTNSGGTFYGSTRNHAGWVYCGINGQQVYGGYTGLPHGMTNGTVLVNTSGSINVGHNDDGTKTVDFYVDLDQSDDDYGHINYYFSDGPRSTGTIGLTTIARASQPSINTWPNNSPDITAGTACTIHMNRKSSSFTHSIWWQFGSSDWHTDGFAKTTGITSNVAWTPPVSMMAKIPNATSGTGSIWVTTYNGDTKIGDKTVSFTLHQPSDANPSISASYAEAGTLADGKTTLSSKGVAATTVIGQISVKKITIRASAKYSASIKSIACTHNGQTQVSSSSSATFTFNAPVNTGSNKSYFSWIVTDSRGNSTSGSTSMTYVNYIKPVVAVVTPSRDSAIVSTGKLSGSGIFFNGTVGSVANSITVTYTYNSAAHTASITKSGNNWSFSNVALSGVDPNGNYSITVKAVDTLGFSSGKTIVLPKAAPTLWIGKETVRVNNYLVAKAWSTNMGRPTSANIQYGKDNVNGGSVRHYLATNAMTEGKPASDGYITQFSWDRYGWDTQVYIADGSVVGSMPPNSIQIRGWSDTNGLHQPGKWESAGLLAYPVGSIYISVNSTSPATLFGGTWEEIYGRFLLARDDSHPAGSTGGEYDHTLSEGEMPAHDHGINMNTAAYSNGVASTVHFGQGEPSSWKNYRPMICKSGNSLAHNNTPPYLSVYMWQRTG